MQEQHQRTAVGKLGVVIAEGRSPRLVVDSSISNVTSNTVIPNHMTLLRISDVMECAPDTMARQQMIQLTLDVSKAHRRILTPRMVECCVFMPTANCTVASH